MGVGVTLSPTKDTVQFGPFKLDQNAWQLYRDGIRIRLPQQPLQLLATLVERPGVVVTREELQNRLWPSEVFVDFDQGLNKNIQKLREGLGDSAESPKYIETIPRVGYRFIGKLAEPPPPVSPAMESSQGKLAEAAVASPVQPLVQPLVRKSVWRRRLLWAVFAGCVAGLAMAVRQVQKRAPALSIHSLAVLPLENLSGDPNKEYFAEGITDDLITELAHIPNLRVVSRTSVMQEKGKTLREIARELDVDAVVEGSVVISGDRVRITAQLIDTRADKHLWTHSFEDKLVDVLSIQDSVAREVASQTRVALQPPLDGTSKQINPEAHDAYLRGLYFLHRREVVKSADYLQQAISLEPSYAAAYAGLALALQGQSIMGWSNLPVGEIMPKALAAAHRAVELDPVSGEAYTALGGVEMSEWDWSAAERHLLRGIALSPSYSLAEMNYAIYLDATNRPDEAVTHMRRALELDPVSFFMTRQMGSVLYFARHYDEAALYLRRAGEMETDAAALVQNWISRINEAKGLRAEAVRNDLDSLKAEAPRFDLGADLLWTTFQQNGWAAYQMARIAALKRRRTDACDAFEIGESYLRLGDHDQAFRYINQAVDGRCFLALWLQVDPLLDSVRNEPQYKRVLQRLKLLP